MASSPSALMTILTGASTQGNAISALIGGIAGMLTPNPVTTQLLNRVQALQMELDNPTAVARTAQMISNDANAAGLLGVEMLADKLEQAAQTVPLNQMMINLLASEVAAAINQAGSSAGVLSHLNFLAPTIASTIAAKPLS